MNRPDVSSSLFINGKKAVVVVKIVIVVVIVIVMVLVGKYGLHN